MNQHFTGYHKARLQACPSRFFLACVILVLSMAMIGSAALASGTAFKKEWQFKLEDRV